MGTYKPENSPYYHYDFQFRKQRYYGSTNCTSKRQADAYERRVRHEIANPSSGKHPINVDEACGLYAEHAELLPSWDTAKYMLEEIVRGLGKNTLLSNVSQRDLELYVAKRRHGLENSSVNREIDVLRAVWWRAKRAKFEIGDMPDWKPLYLKVASITPRELSESEEDAVFDAISDDAKDAVLFLLVSGWRRNEVIKLRWSDVDLGLAQARTRIKGGDEVMRPLNASLVALIANQPKVGPFIFTYVCKKSRGARRAGERYPMTETALRTRWEAARKRAELVGFRLHDLRHTAGTRILRATQNLATTAKALRHSNLKTTMRYAHVLDDDIRDALDAAQSRNSPEMLKGGRRKA